MFIKIKVGLLSLTALVFAVCLTACKGDQEPVEVIVYTNEYGQRLEITALEDNITITNVEINRGNCGAGRVYRMKYSGMNITQEDINPKKYQLVFGQKLTVPVYGCAVKEVDIEANDDNYTFTFDTE